LLQSTGNFLPLAVRMRMKHIRQGAPAAVAGEHGLFGVPGFAAFVFNEPEDADRGDIIAGLLRQPALADPVRLGYAEVARRRRLFRLGLRDWDGAEDGRFSGAIGSSGCGSAHSCIASSHAAW